MQAVQNNGSVYVHAVFTPTGGSPNPQGEHACLPACLHPGPLHGRTWTGSVLPRCLPMCQEHHKSNAALERSSSCALPADEFFDRSATFARTHQLNVYRKKRAAREGINLLSGKNSTGEAVPLGRHGRWPRPCVRSSRGVRWGPRGASGPRP